METLIKLLIYTTFNSAQKIHMQREPNSKQNNCIKYNQKFINANPSLAEYYNDWPLGSRPSYELSHHFSLSLIVFLTHTIFIFIHNNELTPIHDFLHTNLNQILKYIYPLFDSTKFHLRNS